MRITHDLHVHTILSTCCGDPRATVGNLLARAQEKGLSVLGFSDHLWARDAPGGNEWYRSQDEAHVLSIREEIPEATGSLRVLIGCETEFCGGTRIGITPAVAEQFDYVLIPFTHFHMEGFTVDESLSDPKAVAELMIRRFLELMELRLASGVAHPFLPCGFMEQADAILAALDDEPLRECFSRAAEEGVSIEIHSGAFSGAHSDKKQPFSDEHFLRIHSLAKECGCRFHCGSDAHQLDGIGNLHQLQPYLDQIGITEDDFSPIACGIVG